MRKLPNNSSGQALLLVLLSMAVVLTIVLSILARSTVDIGISSRSEESVRAFSAAEAGIEQRLVAGIYGPFSGPPGDSTFSGDVTSFSSGVDQFVLPLNLYSGESAIVWFVSHDTAGNLTCADGKCFWGNDIQVCWGEKDRTYSDANKIPAIELSVVYLTSPGDYTKAQIGRAVFDPYATRRSSNSFLPDNGGDCTIGNKAFAFNKTISFGAGGFEISPSTVYTSVNGLQLARISLLYNTDMGEPVAVKVTGGILPAQGVTIDSSGVSGTSTRKVEVIRGFKELPGIFEPVVFAGGGITKTE